MQPYTVRTGVAHKMAGGHGPGAGMMAQVSVDEGVWTVDDLDEFPDDEWHRYEVIDGELHVAKAPDDEHGRVLAECVCELTVWNRQRGLGEVITGNGIISDRYNGVIPDAVWVSRERAATGREPDKKLHIGPELIVEVLSPGPANARRDLEIKLALYAREGVLEYWVLDPRARTVGVYTREGDTLRAISTLETDATLRSTALDGFTVPVERFLPSAPSAPSA
jgi:Uma2 family endonuclease